MADVELTGLDQLVAMSKALKGWDSEFRKEFNRDVRNLAKPLIPVLRDVLREEYPQRGGLADRMAKARMTPQFLTGRDPGIRVKITGLQVKLGEVYGRLRHPVFADPKKTRREWHWVDQPVLLKGRVQEQASQHAHALVPGMNRVLERAAQHVLTRKGAR